MGTTEERLGKWYDFLGFAVGKPRAEGIGFDGQVKSSSVVGTEVTYHSEPVVDVIRRRRAEAVQCVAVSCPDPKKGIINRNVSLGETLRVQRQWQERENKGR